MGSPVSGLIRGVWGMGDWLAWYGGLGYWVDRLCGWSWGGVLVGCVMFLGVGCWCSLCNCLVECCVVIGS